MELVDKIKGKIRDVKDFPEEGIIFKDITPVLADPLLTADIINHLHQKLLKYNIEAIAGIESRGFFFGILLAQKLEVPFIPIRKEGKLPYTTVKHAYDLEYGSAVIEMHSDAIEQDTRVLIHDDLLATGGTAAAAAELIHQLGGKVAGFSFIIELSFLDGQKKLRAYTENVESLVSY